MTFTYRMMLCSAMFALGCKPRQDRSVIQSDHNDTTPSITVDDALQGIRLKSFASDIDDSDQPISLDYSFYTAEGGADTEFLCWSTCKSIENGCFSRSGEAAGMRLEDFLNPDEPVEGLPMTQKAKEQFIDAINSVKTGNQPQDLPSLLPSDPVLRALASYFRTQYLKSGHLTERYSACVNKAQRAIKGLRPKSESFLLYSEFQTTGPFHPMTGKPRSLFEAQPVVVIEIDIDSIQFGEQERIQFGEQERIQFGEQERNQFGEQERNQFGEQERNQFGEQEPNRLIVRGKDIKKKTRFSVSFDTTSLDTTFLESQGSNLPEFLRRPGGLRLFLPSKLFKAAEGGNQGVIEIGELQVGNANSSTPLPEALKNYKEEKTWRVFKRRESP